jgi:hypothetical protein
VDAFLRDIWQRSACFMDDCVARVQSVSAILPQLPIDDLFREMSPTVRVWDRSSGALRVTDAASADAKDYFRKGATIYDVQFGPLRSIRTDAARLLGVPLERLSCGIFVSPAGATTPCHFDGNDVITVGVDGIKTWSFSTDEIVENPTENWMVGEQIGPQLALYAHELPFDMPGIPKNIAIRRGSLLYLPRGTWHSTYCAESSVSINFTYHAVTWLDLLLHHTNSVLLADPSWRASVPVSAIRDGSAPMLLSQMMRNSAFRYPQFSIVRGLNTVEWRRNPAASCVLTRLSESQIQIDVATLDLLSGRRSQLSADNDVANAVRWILRQTLSTTFTLAVLSQAGGIEAAAAAEVIELLSRARLIVAAEPSGGL